MYIFMTTKQRINTSCTFVLPAPLIARQSFRFDLNLNYQMVLIDIY